ncbi:hypothetical protein [Anaerobiospirillum thomasii]|uniref:hypothetical protein n=1 Tax=Anaerobiospirillum thomasii TaxID=179995 RepID=UPI000DE5AE76|nr:hypothetical protein [Anaerobiospirillum thomasii]
MMLEAALDEDRAKYPMVRIENGKAVFTLSSRGAGLYLLSRCCYYLEVATVAYALFCLKLKFTRCTFRSQPR